MGDVLLCDSIEKNTHDSIFHTRRQFGVASSTPLSRFCPQASLRNHWPTPPTADAAPARLLRHCHLPHNFWIGAVTGGQAFRSSLHLVVAFLPPVAVDDHKSVQQRPIVQNFDAQLAGGTDSRNCHRQSKSYLDSIGFRAAATGQLVELQALHGP